MERKMSEEELFPKTTRFEDGSAIIAFSLINEKYIVTHGKKKYAIKSISTSNYAEKGGTIKIEPTYSVVVEHPYRTEVTPEDLQDYVVEFVRTILHRDFNKKKICHYIGRKDEETNRMIISNKVQKEIVDEILEPELEKRRSDRNYVVRAMIIANMKKQNEK
jgi:hypothetical protein